MSEEKPLKNNSPKLSEESQFGASGAKLNKISRQRNFPSNRALARFDPLYPRSAAATKENSALLNFLAAARQTSDTKPQNRTFSAILSTKIRHFVEFLHRKIDIYVDFSSQIRAF